MIEQYRDKILQGDSLSVLRTLPDSSIDMCITSPPYWGLRNYSTNPKIWDGNPECEHEWGCDIVPGEKSGKPVPNATVGARFAQDNVRRREPTNTCIKCGAWKGELGLEPTFHFFIEHLCQIFDEVKRVLKPEGSCWVNLGDSYASSGGPSRHKGYTDPKYPNGRNGSFDEPSSYEQNGAKPKSLCQIPSRFAIAMTDRGWILRNSIVWHKRNCMPSSASDRFTVDYEMLYFFTKQTKYYFEQQFETYAPASDVRYRQALRAGKSYVTKEPYKKNTPYSNYKRGQGAIQSRGDDGDGLCVGGHNPLGRNKRCVWTINTQPLKEAHFASYPEKLIETPILASCPEFI